MQDKYNYDFPQCDYKIPKCLIITGYDKEGKLLKRVRVKAKHFRGKAGHRTLRINSFPPSKRICVIQKY